jgi:anti-sigma factor RsiW
VSDSRRASDAHAYVDGCLSAAERAAFEEAMARDARLRARVDAWRTQNEAIQSAFGAAPRPRVAERPSNENKPRASALRRAAAARASSRPSKAAFAALAFVALGLWAAGGPADPRAALADRAGSSLRSVAGAPLDFTSGDPGAVTAWLAARLSGLGATLPRAPGWTLEGVRLVPGLGQTAALVVYEDALGQRAGLLLERSDATPDWPSRVERSVDFISVSGASGGLEYAAVGPRLSGAAALAPKIQPPR